MLSRHPAYCERSSAGSGDAAASAPNTALFAVKQLVGSTKTITVADQLHLSRLAGDIRGHYRRRTSRALPPTRIGAVRHAATRAFPHEATKGLCAHWVSQRDLLTSPPRHAQSVAWCGSDCVLRDIVARTGAR